MSTITNNIAAKLSVAFVAAAMVFAFSVPAQAQTTEELQQMINDLLAQISALESQIGQGGSSAAAGVCPYTWTRDLSSGSTGADVMKLQQFLNADPDTRVAATGAGSVGQETSYYGPATGAAVAKFQSKYRSEILSPLGLVNATQYFGASSRAKANDLCVTPTDGGEGDMDGEDGDMDEEDEELSGGEASLEDFDSSDGDDTDLEEGQEDAPVAEFEFDVEDGDVRISRVDVSFTGSGDETDPWDTFDEISLWVDGDKIAEQDASDEDDWSDDDPTNGDNTLRFTGLDQVFREGETAQIVVGVTVQNGVDGTDDGEDWVVFIQDDGLRARDGAGIDQYTGDTNETVSFDIEEEGGEDELEINTSTDDPDATTLEVDDSDKSDWITVFAFDLDTDDSVNDIEVETAVVDVWVNGDFYNQVVNDARLVIDGEEFDDVTVANEGTATATLTFDIDGDLTIDAGDEVTAELQLEFKSVSGNYSEGQTVQASTTAALGWEAEGADDLIVEPKSNDQLRGSAQGEEHTLRSSGVVLEFVDSTETKDSNTDSTTNDDSGDFTIEFEVTAFEDDAYVNKTASNGTVMGTAGVNYLIEDDNGNATSTFDSVSASLDSSADTESSGGTDRFRVAEGETETFTLKVVFDPDNTSFYSVQLHSLNFADTNADPTTQQVANPASDFETEQINIKH